MFRNGPDIQRGTCLNYQYVYIVLCIDLLFENSYRKSGPGVRISNFFIGSTEYMYTVSRTYKSVQKWTEVMAWEMCIYVIRWYPDFTLETAEKQTALQEATRLQEITQIVQHRER
jgi:hypothetical protein